MAQYLYVIGHNRPSGGGVCRPVKVGITKNPDERLKQIKTSAPWPISFVCVFWFPTDEIAAGTEKAFHDHHADSRTNGEWFNVGPNEAAEFLAEYINAFLHFAWCSEGQIDKETLWEARNKSGVYAVEQKLAGERWLQAWGEQ